MYGFIIAICSEVIKVWNEAMEKEVKLCVH